MISRYTITVLLIATASACATSHPGDPQLDAYPAGITGSTEVFYYDIHGRTAPELRAEIRRLGPKTPEGNFSGVTSSPLRWEWRSRDGGASCTLTGVHVVIHSEITLPRWSPPADTVPGMLQEWNRYISALELHEVGHKDISARYAKEVLRTLQNVNTFCSGIGAEIKRTTDGIMGRLKLEQVQYDTDTRHGATQGATFPLLTSSRPLSP